MTKLIILTVILVGTYLSGFSQVSVVWSAFSGEPPEGAKGLYLAVAPDGNIIQVGYTDAGGGDLDFYAAKYDTTGQVLWHTQFHNASNPDAPLDYPRAMALDNDGNVYITGVSQTVSFLDIDWVTIRIDADGSFNWSYVIPASNNVAASGYSLKMGSDNILYVAGRTAERMTLARFDPDGNLLGTATATSVSNQLGFGVDLTLDSDNNVFMVGRFDENEGIAKFDADGNFLWAEACQPQYNYYNQFDKVLLNKTGTSLLIGGTEWGGYLPDGSQVNKVTASYDFSGNQLWFNTFDDMQENQSFIDMETDSDGNVYTMGQTVVNDAKTFIDKYDANGTFQWRVEIDTTGSDDFTDMMVTANNYIVCVGNEGRIYVLDDQGNFHTKELLDPNLNWTYVTMIPGDDYIYACGSGYAVQGGTLMMRLDKLTGLPWANPSGIQLTLAGKNSILLYPNPAEDHLNFQLPLKEMNENVLILDETGRIVLSEKIKDNSIDIARLNKGLYMVEINAGSGKQYSGSFMKN